MAPAISGLVLGLVIGAGWWFVDIPSPAPPLILGAVLVMTIGYIAVDRWMASPSSVGS